MGMVKYPVFLTQLQNLSQMIACHRFSYDLGLT